MNNYSDIELEAAHNHSFANRKTIEKSDQCGCFNCCCSFLASMVELWLSENSNHDDTGQCPGCGIDSLIGDACGISLTHELLVAMNEKYFNSIPEPKIHETYDEMCKYFEKLMATT